ncbi:hypothetical protein GQ53DRAFT_82491 [Thozetella sp. PMI_491]|nr:hypothetical protein GQ53DRAFT_82491 [Thozetella sp. PMI_491]
MQITRIFAVLATGLAFAAAQDDIETTTTSTQTLTQYVTITKCNPTVTNCPARTNSSTVAPTTSSVWSYSKNSTVSSGPTAYPNSTSTYVAPTSKTPVTQTTAVSPSKSSATTVPTGAAGSLFVQSGLMAGVLGVAVALLA